MSTQRLLLTTLLLLALLAPSAYTTLAQIPGPDAILSAEEGDRLLKLVNRLEGQIEDANPAIENTWEIVCVDCPRWFESVTERSLRLDTNDRPHIAYGGDNLYYASYESGAWQVEIVDPSPQVGKQASLSLDDSDRPHISYLDAANRALRYAYKDALGWHVETVDAGLVDVEYLPTSIALHAGKPTISYSTPDALKVARRDSSGWITETVVSGANPVSSLAIDPSGEPHVAFASRTFPNSDLRYAHRTGAGWQVELVASVAHPVEGVSLALDSQGRPRISYAADELRYASYDGFAWHFETIDPVQAGGNASLTLTTNNVPIVGYVQVVEEILGYTPFAVRLATRTASGWEVTTVDGFTVWHGDYGSGSISLALAGDETPVVTYTKPGEGSLLISGAMPGVPPTVDTSAWIQGPLSLAIDSQDGARVIYVRRQGDEVRLASGHWTTESLTWQFEDASTSPRYVVTEACLALDSQDRQYTTSIWRDIDAQEEYLLYSGPDCGTRDLRWSIVQGGWIGVDGQDHPHMTFQEAWASGGNNWHRYCDGQQWQYEAMVGPTARCGEAAIDNDGYLHVFNFATYRYQDANGWQSENVSCGRDTGALTWGEGLALDGSDVPHVVFRSAGVTYAKRTVAGWQCEVVDSEGQLGSYSTLAVDAAGQPSIGYYDAAAGALKVARKGAAGWSIQTVTAYAGPALVGSLELDSAGAPVMAYVDMATGDLKLALWRSNPLQAWHGEAEDGALTGSMQRSTGGGASACYYVFDPVANSGSTLALSVTVPAGDHYYLWALAMGLGWDRNSFWVSVDGAPSFPFEIGQFGGQWTWGWEQVHAEGQPVAPFALRAGQHTVVFSSREPFSRLDAVLLVNRSGYVPTQFTPCRTAPWTSQPPIIDGNLSDWGQWSPLLLNRDTAFFVATQPAGSPPPTLADNSAELRALWTAGHLYIATFVRDDAIVNDSPEVWRDDEIELAFVGAWDGNPAGGDTHQYTVNADGRLTDFGIPSNPVPLQVAVLPVTGGWNVELRIPASHLLGLNAPLAAGKTMAFDLGLHDDDDGGTWDSHMIWAGDSTYSQAGGLLRLDGAIAPTPVPTATPTATSSPTLTATPTATPSPTATATWTPTPTASPTATPTATPSPTATATWTPTPTASPTATPTATATATPTPTVTASATPTATPLRRYLPLILRR